MAPIDSRLYKPVRTTGILYATKGTAEPFSKLRWGRGRGSAWKREPYATLLQGKCPSSPLFLDQTEARRAEKIFLETGPSPYLKVWIQALGNCKRQNK